MIASVGEGWGSTLFGSEVGISGPRKVGLQRASAKKMSSRRAKSLIVLNRLLDNVLSGYLE